MANVKITELTSYTNPASTDVVPIVDIGADATKKVTIADLLENAGSGSASAPAFAFDGDSNTGIYRPGADQLAISTGGTGRLFIDSSGQLLVGTSTAQTQPTASRFQVSGDDFATSSIRQTRFESALSGPTIILAHARGSEASNQSLNNSDEFGKIRFYGHDGTDFANLGAEIKAVVDGTPGSNDMPGRLVFSTTADGASSPTERMRIDSSGTLLVATTSTNVSSNEKLTVNGISTFFRNQGSAVNVKRTGNNGDVINFLRDTTAVGTISVTASATAYNTSSDYRLKENVVDIADGITRVKQLQPKRFNFIADADTTVDGFIAHEAQTVVPEAVTGTHNEVDDDNNPVYQGIDQSKLVPLLTAALQEAIAKIETLETKVAALEAQ